MAALLELANISKSFPGVKALEDVHFNTDAGQVHALVGENGAGKSTLIKVISGVHPADSGTIHMDGELVRFRSPHEAQAHGIATMYQELSLYPELSVAENIFMGHAPMRRAGPAEVIDWGEMNRRSEEILASLNIHDLDVRRKVGALNVGNRQRVEIAKALSLNAKVLIMDEPTAALTESDVERLFDIVRLLKERDVAVIYISHRLVEVFQLADKVTVLRDGRFVDSKPVSETDEDDLIRMMVGRTITDLFPKLPTEVGDPVLEVKNLNRHPQTKEVSFTVRSGEIVGVAGLVGSGRSETAQVVFGILQPDSGEIIVEGRPVRVKSPTQAMKLGIAYVPEDRGTQGLVREMRIRENLSMAILDSLTRLGFVMKRDERKLGQGLIEQLNIIATGGEQVVNKLSGGNQQKVVVGKWLASKPRMLIVDEPTRGVDVGARAELYDVIDGLSRRGLGLLLSSSDTEELIGLSDRILVFRSGRVATELRPPFDYEEVVAHVTGARQLA
jgi:rhamnose transport system ATP-binding protein